MIHRPPLSATETGTIVIVFTLADGRRIILRPVPTVHVSDDALIRAIVGAVGDLTFNSKELKGLAQFAGPLRDILGGLSTLEIGYELKAIKGQDFDGFVLESQGTDKSGTLWRVFARG